jgi:hypothetical protein
MANLTELREVGRKEEVEQERERLLVAARGWYEEEDAFHARVSDAESRFTQAAGGKKK